MVVFEEWEVVNDFLMVVVVVVVAQKHCSGDGGQAIEG